MGWGRFLAVAAALVLLVPAAAVAQSQINGSVTDDTGGVLPGVTVEASSPVLIEGSRLTVTDGTGAYNIIDLRPGVYTMTFTLPGFGTQVRDELILGANLQLLIDVALSVGSVEETITVSGETPVVDVQQVQRIEVMTRETQEAIPTGRSMWSYALLIPGVKVHKPDMGGTAGAQQSEMMGRGLDAAHTTIEIDGMMINTMISDGRYQAYLNPMIAAETSYTTTGVTAETQSGGLRINMIPNEGGNQFSGQLFAGGTPSSLQANNLNQRLQDLGVTAVPMVDIIYDLNGSIGGPVVRDKLWFFSTARRNVIDAGVTNSIMRDGSPALDRNSITSANVRLTWQMNSQNKISAMFDKVRKRRFSQHGFGTDLETASSSWTSPHYDTGTAKWTSTISNRMLAEFGFSLAYEDWDPGYYRFGDIPIFQEVPAETELATCFSTPCFPAVGSARHMNQMNDPWYSTVHHNDSWLDFRYEAMAFEQNNYSHRWAYTGALSYVTGSHSVKVGMNITNGQNRFANNGNGDLQQNYRNEPSQVGRSLGFINANCDHYAARANTTVGLPCGTIGTPDSVGVFNHPAFAEHLLDYNGGVYAQDSWTIDRLTLNYGGRVDFASVSVPATPHPQGRFVGAFEYPAGFNFDANGNNIGGLPKFGPDFSPRFSMAYDVFGDARTALKFGFNKYVRDVGGNLPSRYATASRATDTRDWFDCHLQVTGNVAGCSGLDPYGANDDDIAQNWEIGPGLDIFGYRSPGRYDPNNFARESNQIWTVGVQQEVVSGLSISGEFRRRWYSNVWSTDNYEHGLSNFGANSDGTPNPAMAGTGRYFDVLRPYPMLGTFTAFTIDPTVRTLQDSVDATMPEYTNVYKGFELSVQGRMPGGGTLFGGWTIEDTGRNTLYNYNKGAGSRYGGEVNNCADVLRRGDNPNELRFCDQGAYPRPFRNEFKLSGAQPFSVPGLGDLQVGASLQAYPGGAGDWGGLQEGFRVSRTSSNVDYATYSDNFYGQPGHCVAPCVLGQRLVPDGVGTIGTSTSSFYFPMVPLNSVKFLPYWTQLDANIQKVFNIGNWRYDARIEAFNMLNNAVEIWHTGSRNAAGMTGGGGFQSLAAFERADKLLEGRVIRFAVTARF